MDMTRDWCVLAAPHGGFVMAVLLKAADTGLRWSSNNNAKYRDPLWASAQFLGVLRPGKVRFHVRVVKMGAAYANVHVSATQRGRQTQILSAIFGNFDRRDATMPSYTQPRLQASRPKAVDVDTVNKGELQAASTLLSVSSVFGHFDMQFRKIDHRAVELWTRWKDARPHDAISLAMFADMAPPHPLVVDFERAPRSVEEEKHSTLSQVAVPVDQRGKFWFPTLEMSITFHARPESLHDHEQQWVLCTQTLLVGTNGMFEEVGVLSDVGGRILATYRQLASSVSTAVNFKKGGKHKHNSNRSKL
eukprot:TRINITY_DN35776_c0_g1_i2.p1 TRINITY_DN35776_c0_g1~~TRINITY_DN35776_c0_g1_i2.p1  ORF type:complete len:341 (+),score=115.59 TRINITY_DN35776_c0_g1_i2:114-1025(+)